MPVAQPQAIAGVSAASENVVLVEYPSIGGAMIGKGIGSIYEGLNSIASKRSSKPGSRSSVAVLGFLVLFLLVEVPLLLLVTAIAAPLGILGIIIERLFGNKYVVTNRTVQIWKSLGATMLQSVPLGEIADIQTQQAAGQEFYRCGDVILLGKGDKILLRLDGVPNPQIFRELLLQTRDARVKVESALKTINSR